MRGELDLRVLVDPVVQSNRHQLTAAAVALLALGVFAGMIFVALLVTMMLLRPEGLLPSARRKAELHEFEDHSERDVYDDLYDVRREGET